LYSAGKRPARVWKTCLPAVVCEGGAESGKERLRLSLSLRRMGSYWALGATNPNVPCPNTQVRRASGTAGAAGFSIFYYNFDTHQTTTAAGQLV